MNETCLCPILPEGPPEKIRSDAGDSLSRAVPVKGVLLEVMIMGYDESGDSTVVGLGGTDDVRPSLVIVIPEDVQLSWATSRDNEGPSVDKDGHDGVQKANSMP